MVVDWSYGFGFFFLLLIFGYLYHSLRLMSFVWVPGSLSTRRGYYPIYSQGGTFILDEKHIAQKKMRNVIRCSDTLL